MPPRSRPTPTARAWARRLRSAEFRRRLTALVAAELAALGRAKVGEVVDARLAGELIGAWDTRLVDRRALAELAIATNRRGARRLARRGETLAGLLDDALLAELDAALGAQFDLSPRAREFVAALVEREFVTGLFTDLIFTALVSFQRRANPLFGALAVHALEDQIKGFIRLFMPMLQAQATAFATDRANQRAVLDFARAAARQLLDLPLDRWAALAGGAAPERLLRRAAADAGLADLGRRAALAAWDDLFAAARGLRVGTLLRLEEHADWLAVQAVDALLPLLQRDAVVAFVAAELDALRG